MARQKKQVKFKEPVRIRTKPLSNGNRSIFLDVYWKGVRKYEYLKLYLVPELDAACRDRNNETMAVAERIKAERIMSLNGHSVAEWDSVKKGAMLLTQWIEEYCKGGIGVKESTLHTRYEMLNTVEKYLASINRRHISLDDIDADFCRGYVKFLRSFPNSRYTKDLSKAPVSSANTASSYFALFSTCMNNAVKAGILRENPVNKLEPRERLQRKEGRKEYLTIEEVKLLMDTDCYRHEVKQAFLFACFTGLRLSDIYALTPRHIVTAPDGCTQYISIEMKKTGRPVTIPLSQETRRWLPEAKGDNVPFFDLPTTATVIGRALRMWAEAAGIRKHLSFHVSRHTFGTMMLTLGADIYTTSKLMGHTNIKTTEIYAKIVDKKKEEAINLIDGFFK